jgi:hypothetical protein
MSLQRPVAPDPHNFGHGELGFVDCGRDRGSRLRPDLAATIRAAAPRVRRRAGSRGCPRGGDRARRQHRGARPRGQAGHRLRHRGRRAERARGRGSPDRARLRAPRRPRHPPTVGLQGVRTADWYEHLRRRRGCLSLRNHLAVRDTLRTPRSFETSTPPSSDASVREPPTSTSTAAARTPSSSRSWPPPA